MGKSPLKNIFVTSAALSLTALGGCSFGNSSTTDERVAKKFMNDGAITISRPAPAAQTATKPATMLAFLPVDAQKKGKWISINRSHGTVTLMSNEEAVVIAKGKGFDSLKPGSYEIAHKQRSAPWHASDQYFLNRNMEVPAAGSKERFLRGALGEFVLFLNEQLPLHSGPIWAEEIGGVQLSEQDISRIYYSIPAGSVVEVQ
jgi:hypothetical protein